MVFGFENIMDFTIDIDKLNLANLVGKVMDKIMVVPDYFAIVYRKIKARDLLKITKPQLLHRKS